MWLRLAESFFSFLCVRVCVCLCVHLVQEENRLDVVLRGNLFQDCDMLVQYGPFQAYNHVRWGTLFFPRVLFLSSVDVADSVPRPLTTHTHTG